MRVSSTLSTSAPKSASISEQKPPGRRRERSRTLTPSSGSRVTLATPPAPSARRRSRGHLGLEPEHLARLGHGGGATADVLGHLARLGDQVAVGAGHLAVGQIEVVLDAGPDVA